MELRSRKKSVLLGAFLLLLGLVAFSSCTKPNPQIELLTSHGRILLDIYQDDAPITASNFLRYVDEQRFEGATFYRVVTMRNQPNNEVKIEVIQGGLSFSGEHPNNLPPIRHETTEETGILHKDGVISMARVGPGTAAGEIFICVGDQLRRGIQFVLIECSSCWILGATSAFPTARCPRFTGIANEVSVLFQQVRVGLEFFGEDTGVGSGFFQLPYI